MPKLREWSSPDVPDDVMMVQDRHGRFHVRGTKNPQAWYVIGGEVTGQNGKNFGELLTWCGPLTEAVPPSGELRLQALQQHLKRMAWADRRLYVGNAVRVFVDFLREQAEISEREADHLVFDAHRDAMSASKAFAKLADDLEGKTGS